MRCTRTAALYLAAPPLLRRLRPGVAAAVVAASLATIPVLPESFTNRMVSIFNPEEDPTGSREARKRLLEEGWATFLANPLVGVGAGQFVNYQPEGREREEAWRETHNAGARIAYTRLGMSESPYLVYEARLDGSGDSGSVPASGEEAR